MPLRGSKVGRPSRWAGHGGDGKIGAIIALLVVVFVAYVLIKVIPVRISKMEFAEEVERAAQEYTVNVINYDTLIQRILSAAGEQEIPVAPEGIRIEDGSSEVQVEVEYTVVLPMVWGDWEQNMKVEKRVPRL